MEIAGFNHGYFENEKEILTVYRKIIKTKSDIVVVGTGTPRQEKFLIDLRQNGWDGIGFTCGGFLHQIIEGIHYYPSIFDKLHIRWLYRIIDEPKLLKRYLIDYSMFVFVFVYDLFISLFIKRDS